MNFLPFSKKRNKISFHPLFCVHVIQVGWYLATFKHSAGLNLEYNFWNSQFFLKTTKNGKKNILRDISITDLYLFLAYCLSFCWLHFSKVFHHQTTAFCFDKFEPCLTNQLFSFPRQIHNNNCFSKSRPYFCWFGNNQGKLFFFKSVNKLVSLTPQDL